VLSALGQTPDRATRSAVMRRQYVLTPAEGAGATGPASSVAVAADGSAVAGRREDHLSILYYSVTGCPAYQQSRACLGLAFVLVAGVVVAAPISAPRSDGRISRAREWQRPPTRWPRTAAGAPL
jgi:hypothetical protein